jgi:hypothetical protein
MSPFQHTDGARDAQDLDDGVRSLLLGIDAEIDVVLPEDPRDALGEVGVANSRDLGRNHRFL